MHKEIKVLRNISLSIQGTSDKKFRLNSVMVVAVRGVGCCGDHGLGVIGIR